MNQITRIVKGIMIGLFFTSCSNKPNEKIAKSFLEEKINIESHGVVYLKSFDIVSENERELLGSTYITYTYHGILGFNKECWKPKSIVGNTWSDYKVGELQPETSIMDMLAKPLHFTTDDVVEIEGEIEYKKSEEGWRLN